MAGYFTNVYTENKPVITVVEPNKADCLFRTAKAADGQMHFVTEEMNTIMAGLACGEPCPIAWEVLRGCADDFISFPDYAAAKGEKVSAPAAGKVTLAGADGSWGPTVAIEDASGRLWRISGVADLKVKAGDTVTAGQALGTVGSVSCECAEDSHIHLEVKQGEKYLDPAKVMQ